jgi:hypothetical protein
MTRAHTLALDEHTSLQHCASTLGCHDVSKNTLTIVSYVKHPNHRTIFPLGYYTQCIPTSHSTHCRSTLLRDCPLREDVTPCSPSLINSRKLSNSLHARLRHQQKIPLICIWNMPILPLVSQRKSYPIETRGSRQSSGRPS